MEASIIPRTEDESAADNTEGGACGRGYEAVEVSLAEYCGNSRRGEYISKGSRGGRGAPEVVLVYCVTGPSKHLSFEQIYLRTAWKQPCSTRLPRRKLDCMFSRDDGRRHCVQFNHHDDPLLGDYYIFVDGAGGNGEDEVIIDEVPWYV